MEYKKTYSFMVLNNIKEGKSVYMLDRKARAVLCVNDMCVGDAMEIIDSQDEERFEFWYEEVAEDAEL
jgi:hypothetical protein